MDLSRPHAAVMGGALEGDVLAVLAGTTKPLTGRQVARLAKHGSDRGVRLALNRLAEQGLVDTVEAPPAVLYTLNRDHIAAPIAFELAGMRAELVKRLRDAASEWQVPVVHASMFGSAARGEGDVHSDIDLLVVRRASMDAEHPIWRAQLDDLRRNVERWTGNHAGISELGEEEIAGLAAERPPIVDDLERDAVTLAGIEAHRLFDPKRSE
jgi:DNA-binding transcriptional ArsR family regulator